MQVDEMNTPISTYTNKNMITFYIIDGWPFGNFIIGMSATASASALIKLLLFL